MSETTSYDPIAHDRDVTNNWEGWPAPAAEDEWADWPGAFWNVEDSDGDE